MIRRNVARISIENNGKIYEGHIFCVGGHLWVTNNHILPLDGDLSCEIVFEKRSQGASRNMSVLIDQSSILRQVDQDLAWFEMLNIEPKRDYSGLICKPSLQGMHRAVTIASDKNSVPINVLCHNVSRVFLKCDNLKMANDVWTGTSLQPTYNGYCGSVMLAVAPAVVILGLHQRYKDGTIVSTRLSENEFKAARLHFTRPLIQSSPPQLSAQGVEKELTPLHHNAHVRYLTEGHITVYGSIPSTNVQPRSKVSPTFIADKITADRGWQTDCVAPNLRDWRMWKHGITDVVNQKHLIRSSVLDKCVIAMTNEILKDLPVEQLNVMHRFFEFTNTL